MRNKISALGVKNKIKSFFWGILAAGTALFLELFFASFLKIEELATPELTLTILIIASVLIEEIIKYTIVLKILNTFSFGKNLISNAWLAGIGFSLVEIFIFYQKIVTESMAFNQEDLLKVGLFHIITFGIFGYIIAISKNNKLRIGTILIIIILHFTYNMLTQYPSDTSIIIGNIILLTLLSFNIISIILVNKRLAQE